PPVQIATEISVVTVATMRLFMSERIIRTLSQTSAYHFSVNPSHRKLSLDALNEYTTSTRIGRYRKTNTPAVHAPKPRFDSFSPDGSSGRVLDEGCMDNVPEQGRVGSQPRR